MHPRPRSVLSSGIQAACASLVLLLSGGCLDAVLLADDAAEEVSRPDEGEACDGTETARCSGDFKSSCVHGRWASVECLGPRGCSSFSIALCDQRLGAVGGRCIPEDTWTAGTCALDGSAELRCSQAGTFERVRDCPGGCAPDGEGTGIHCR